jgi:hypothetical protein
MFRSLVVSIFIFLLATVEAFAADPVDLRDREKSAKIRQNLIQTELSSCSLENAIQISFGDLFDPTPGVLASNPIYDAKCVTVEALAHWRRLIRDSKSRYVTSRIPFRRNDPNLRQHIGLAGHELMLEHALMDKAQSGQVTGVLSDCRTLFLPMGGYCHYESGPFLILVDIDKKAELKIERLVGLAAAGEYGNLGDMDMTSSFAPNVEVYFETWLNAIARGMEDDFEYVKSIFAGGNEDYMQWNEYALAAGRDDIKSSYYRGLYDAFFGENSPYQNPALVTGERRYFVKNLPEPEDYKSLQMLSCVCLEESCDGKWPISTADNFVSNDLPYLCHSHWWSDEGWKSYLPSPIAPYRVTDIEP